MMCWHGVQSLKQKQSADDLWQAGADTKTLNAVKLLSCPVSSLCSIGLSGPWDFVIKPFLPLELYSWQVDFDGLCSFLLLPMLMLEWWCLPWSWNTLSRSKTCHLFWMYFVYSNLLLRPGSHSAWGFQGVLLRFCLASTRQQKFWALKAETFIILFVFLKPLPCGLVEA